MLRLAPLLLLALAACGTSADTDAPADTDTDSEVPLPPIDEDVQNVAPAGYVPENPTRIIFLGDSITAGDGTNEERQLYKAILQENAARWTGFDDVDLETSFPSIAEVVDVSVGGATTDTMLVSQLADLESQLAFPASGETLIVFTIGGNDLQAALVPFANAQVVVDKTLGNLAEIIDWLQDPAKFPDGAYLHVTNVYEPTDGIGQYDDCFFGIDFEEKMPYLEAYNQGVADMANEKGFAAVDLRGHFLGHGWNYMDMNVPQHDMDDMTLWMLDDCIHPNPRGHHELRRLFHASITGQPFRYILPAAE
jgi:lysophospholipase L1-like esterase